MKKYLAFIFCSLFFMPAAMANWQYPGDYLGDGWYMDDGSRITVSARGGVSFVSGGVLNKMGSKIDLVGTDEYGDLYADIAQLKPTANLSDMSFAGGISVGMVLPQKNNWRLEFSWDHISSDYDAVPLFSGSVDLLDGNGQYAGSGIVDSDGVKSKIATDIIGVAAYYDFFNTPYKQLDEFIPYIGFGIGYADVETQSYLVPMSGTLDVDTNTKTSSGTVAGMLALGLSYGVAENMFLDLSARLNYMPKIKWEMMDDLGNARDWFAAENVIYTNLMLGLRFEF